MKAVFRRQTLSFTRIETKKASKFIFPYLPKYPVWGKFF